VKRSVEVTLDPFHWGLRWLYCINPYDKDQCVLGFFPRGKWPRGLITHLCLATRLRMSGAVLLLPLHLNGVDRNNFSELCHDDDIRCMLKWWFAGETWSTWRNTFSPLVCCKSFNNLERINQDSYLLMEYILISTTHLSSGYYSWRNPDAGTWFIQCLCKELQEHASTKDFLKILTRTSRRVAIDYESYNDVNPWHHQQKQVPSFNSMLIRDLYFRPKIL
jgi:Caspase domain.